MRKLEKPIETQCLSYLHALGVFVWKVDRQGTYDPRIGRFRANKNPFKIKGVPDIQGILPGGRALHIEVKSETGKLSEHQKDFAAMAQKCGALILCVRSLDELIQKLNNALTDPEKLSLGMGKT